MNRPSHVAKPLSSEERALLREVVARQAPELLGTLPRADLNVLLPDERRRLCDLISTEFMQTGLGPDDEPNPRGLKLESLLDSINRPNLFPG